MQYCQGLTEIKTRSLKAFFEKALRDTSRAAEPLLLLALCQGREEYLERLAAGTRFEEKYQVFLEGFKKSGNNLEDYLKLDSAPRQYKKIYLSYRSKTEQLERDRRVLESLIDQVNLMVKEAGITRYELSKNLNINKGNLYAFLKGDTSKLSRSTAMNLYNHLSAL